MAAGPLVSVGMPVYNAERFLEQAIRSVLAQTCGDLELIISDNASEDATEAIAQDAASADRRVRYVRAERNLGAAPNFNRTVELAGGRYFKWAAHDDLIAPEFLARCVAALEQDPGVVLAYPRAVDIDDAGLVFHRWGSMPLAGDDRPAARLDEVLRVNHRAFPIFGVTRLDELLRTSLIRPFGLSDLLTLGELALLGRWHEVPEELFRHREHPGRSTRSHATKDERAAWFSTHRAGRPALPHWHLLFGYASAVRRTPMPARDRVAALAVIGRWAGGHGRILGHEAKVAVMNRRGRRDRMVGPSPRV